jgi:hypothetical protein
MPGFPRRLDTKSDSGLTDLFSDVGLDHSSFDCHLEHIIISSVLITFFFGINLIGNIVQQKTFGYIQHHGTKI